MSWKGWPAKIPTGNNTIRVTVTGKGITAGLVAAFTTRAEHYARNAAEREVSRFLRVAHNTPSAGGGSVVVVDPPRPYPRRYVRKYDPQTLVMLEVKCRMYLNMKTSAR